MHPAIDPSAPKAASPGEKAPKAASPDKKAPHPEIELDFYEPTGLNRFMASVAGQVIEAIRESGAPVAKVAQVAEAVRIASAKDREKEIDLHFSNETPSYKEIGETEVRAAFALDFRFSSPSLTLVGNVMEACQLILLQRDRALIQALRLNFESRHPELFEDTGDEDGDDEIPEYDLDNRCLVAIYENGPSTIDELAEIVQELPDPVGKAVSYLLGQKLLEPHKAGGRYQVTQAGEKQAMGLIEEDPDDAEPAGAFKDASDMAE